MSAPRLTHGPLRSQQPRTEAGRRLLDRLEGRCESLGGCDVKGADHTDTERAIPAIEAEAVAAERERLRVAVEGLRAFGRYKVDMDGDRAVMLDEVLRLLTPDLP